MTMTPYFSPSALISRAVEATWNIDQATRKRNRGLPKSKKQPTMNTGCYAQLISAMAVYAEQLNAYINRCNGQYSSLPGFETNKGGMAHRCKCATRTVVRRWERMEQAGVVAARRPDYCGVVIEFSKDLVLPGHGAETPDSIGKPADIPPEIRYLIELEAARSGRQSVLENRPVQPVKTLPGPQQQRRVLPGQGLPAGLDSQGVEFDDATEKNVLKGLRAVWGDILPSFITQQNKIKIPPEAPGTDTAAQVSGVPAAQADTVTGQTRKATAPGIKSQEKSARKTGGKPPGHAPGPAQQGRLICAAFCGYALDVLWPQRRDTFSQHDKARMYNAVKHRFFWGLHDRIPTEQLQVRKQELEQAVNKAQLWFLKRHWVALPHPEQYFGSPDTPINFFRALDYHQKTEREKRLDRVLMEWQAWQRQQGRKRGKYAGKTAGYLHRVQRQRLARTGDALLLKQYDTLVSAKGYLEKTVQDTGENRQETTRKTGP